MKILLTGSSNGVGKELKKTLSSQHEVDCPTRLELDLNDAKSVVNYVDKAYDMLINCAGTGVGGKIDFVHHTTDFVQEILQVNFVNVVLLVQQVLRFNAKCKIINITSTNNKRYWPNDLAYSLSKKCLETFGTMLTTEYPKVRHLEVRLGLTKTNFNCSRYKHEPERLQDIYSINEHLMPNEVAQKIVDVAFDDRIKFIEISP
jgi:short-subunit dehydrogenase